MTTILYTGENDILSPSRDLWAKCPILGKSVLEQCGMGTFFSTDFNDLSNTYTLTQATAGTITLKEEAGGIAAIDSGSTTTTQGPNIQWGPAGFVGATKGYEIYMEARIKAPSGIGTAGNYFIGLAATDTTLIATSALSSQAIGFVGLGVNTITGTSKGGSGATSTATLTTLTAATAVKLGMLITSSRVKFWVNGVLSSEVITTNIATAQLRPTIVVQSRGTTQPILDMDWFHCYQNRAA